MEFLERPGAYLALSTCPGPQPASRTTVPRSSSPENPVASWTYRHSSSRVRPKIVSSSRRPLKVGLPLEAERLGQPLEALPGFVQVRHASRHRISGVAT